MLFGDQRCFTVVSKRLLAYKGSTWQWGKYSLVLLIYFFPASSDNIDMGFGIKMLCLVHIELPCRLVVQKPDCMGYRSLYHKSKSVSYRVCCIKAWSNVHKLLATLWSVLKISVLQWLPPVMGSNNFSFKQPSPWQTVILLQPPTNSTNK